MKRSFSSARSTSRRTTATPRNCARSSRSCGSSGHPGQLEELDAEGILAFAERVLPRAADLWVQASLEQRQRFQQLFFPDGISFDGNGFVGTAAIAPAFSYLREIESKNEGLVAQIFPRWNRVADWLKEAERFRRRRRSESHLSANL